MRPPADWARTIAPALALLGLHPAAAHGSRSVSDTALSAAPAATEVCESRTINYITHTLPQQCLRTAWTSPTAAATTITTTEEAISATPTATTTTTTTASDSPEPTEENGTAQEREQDAQEDLSASSFMSFEEWKEMMLRKSGRDPAAVKPHGQREHRGERDPSMNNAEFDGYGEEGEISLDFDALAEKVSEMASPSPGADAAQKNQDVKEEQILYDDGKTQYYRSKDAGKTCKERFSYSSFDAGATVLKTSPGAKNAKAILVENKDSYMLLECRTQNKFVVIELSDDILVDTVVLANFEFFSSMIRKFRVSASDRYPVKTDKWVDLGTFEARNARDIQAFLVEHPQIYTKYIRIEFLSHYGNEFYCPVSLLRVHGTRMLDTWKEPTHDDEPEQIQGSAAEPVTETQQVQESVVVDNPSVETQEEDVPDAVPEMGVSPWTPVFPSNPMLEICALRSPTTADPTPVASGVSKAAGNKPAGDSDTVTSGPPVATGAGESSRSASSPSRPASPEAPISQGQSTTAIPTTAPSVPPHAGNDSSADATDTPSSTTATASRNKTGSASSPPSASPTVQESFFKTITKRLQLLESNTSLSLQYIEEQSRFLQDVLLKMERKHITRVDNFLVSLNKTVLSELRNVRTQYDQIWQSTVIALETQREQSQREIVALTSRLNVLADEVVFQKRMAILQSVLLLACLVLVIFSRGGLAALDNSSFTGAAFPSSASASASYRRYATRWSRQGGDWSESSLPPETGTTLAASALPRHLYSTSAARNMDKTLPLTPSPSDYDNSRDNTPARHIDTDNDVSPEPSFYDQGSSSQHHHTARQGPGPRPGDLQVPGGGGGQSDAEMSPNEGEASPIPSPPVDETPPTPPTPTRGQGSFGGTQHQGTSEAENQGEGEKEKPPLARARSTMSQVGRLRKPLPALPEDPS